MRARRIERQDGIALPVAVFVLSMVMLLTAVALISAMGSNRRTNKDLEVKLALQAANAGLDLARDRLNPSKITGALTPALPCVGLQDAVGPTVVRLVPSVVDGLLPGWCPAVTERYDNGATSSYRLSTDGLVGSLLGGVLGLTGPRTIVSTGTYANTTRKVAMTVEPRSTIQSYFGAYGITSNKDVNLSNGATMDTSVRSNTRVRVRLDLCGGVVTSGPGTTPVADFTNGGTYCGAPAANAPAGKITAAPSTFALPQVDYSGAKNSNNDLALCGVAPLYLLAAAPGKCSGYPGARPTIAFDDYRTYTIPGGDYYFCKWSMTGGGGKLVIPLGATVRVYIGSPEDCGGTNDKGNSFTRGNGFIVDNQNKDPATFQVYVAGSSTLKTDNVLMGQSNGVAEDHMTIYAPNSAVLFENNQRFNGAVAGDTVTVTGGGFVRSTASTQSVGTAGTTTVMSSAFRECVTTSSSAPDAGCAVG